MSTPYGSWPSPIDAKDMYAASVQLDAPRVDGAEVYWVEGRPEEAGRSVLVRLAPEGTLTDLTPPPWNVRSRVHEYGGGAYAVSSGQAVFVEFTTGQVIRLDADGPHPITPDAGEAAVRFGGLVLDLPRRAVYAVREDHRGDGEPVNLLVRLDLDGDNAQFGEPVLGTTHPTTDFVSAPALSTDGRRLAWITWDHPDMPWDSSSLVVADLDEHGLATGERHLVPVAGGPGTSVEEPTWLGPDRLLFISDRTGFGNLYTVDLTEDAAREPEAVAPGEVEFGCPRWMLDMRVIARTGTGTVVARATVDGFGRLAAWDPGSREVRMVALEASDVTLIVGGEGSAGPADDTVVARARFVDGPVALVRIDVTDGSMEVLRSSSDLTIDPGYVSRPEPVSWTSEDGATAHGFFYPPTHPEAQAPPGDRPPLIVTTHGGPTGATFPGFSPGILYWTSRGIGVLDVNYGGSTGYGRAYRQRLQGRWGIVDVADATSGALALAAAGRADRNRMAITGGSAGGYTTLAALTFRDAFAAGASHYGISDLSALAAETHKFESRYCTGLVGPWPEAAATYAERSPIHHTDQLNCPIILLQGEQDRVVPPNQADLMAQALRDKGLPVALLRFEGEGHGFRSLDSLVRAREAEEAFYGRVFGYLPAGDLPDLEIENL